MIATILIPILGAFIVLCFGRWHSVQRALAVAITAFTCLLSVLRLAQNLLGNVYTWHVPFIPGFDLFLRADALSSFMAFVSSLVGALIVIYSIGYMRDDEHQSEYYCFVLLFIGSMMGLVYSCNLILMYIFWEMTAICSWRLIGHHRNEPQHLVNADKAFIITIAGSACMLIGFELLFQKTHTLNLTQLQGVVPTFGVALLIVIGIIAKSAQVPLQTWLPDAGVAPTPVTALLHAAVLVKIGAFAFARIFLTALVLPPGFNGFFLVLLLIGVIVTACAALVENDMKRILAYSTISQIGLILIGFTLGNPAAVAGALFYILAHGIAKAGLFLGVGVIDHYMKERDIRKLRGMARLFPANGFGFLLCALSIMGIPPFGGFFAKVLIILGALQQHNLVVALGIGLAAVLSILYMMRLWTVVFMGAPSDPKAGRRFDLMSLVVVILGVLSLLTIGLLRYPIDMIASITQQILR
jgi:NADH:ubiquinone oxidoreductase subunit 5 (subunit L)/multisubunit Na+/H+ antiporter MnhA subunit